MAKTGTTKLIERALFNNFYIKRGMRCALEVEVPRLSWNDDKTSSYCWWGGRVDFLAHKDGKFYAIEIKVSKSDFKSKHGHNLVGDYNYYAIPDYLVDKVEDLIPPHVGIYVISTRDENEKTWGLYKWEKDYKLTNYRKAKKVDSVIDRYLKKYKKDKSFMIDSMFTSLNSTVRRMLNE